MTFHEDRHPGRGAPAGTTTRSAPLGVADAGGQPQPASAQVPWEQCDRCLAPVDRDQRYCVACGTHQSRPDDPVVRFFSSARRPRVAPVAVAAGGNGGRTVPITVAALFLALLPVAAGVGIVVGRGSDHSGDQVIEALKVLQRTAPVTGVAGSTPTTTDTAAAAGSGSDSASSGKTVDGIATSDKEAPVLAKGPTGTARKLEGNKPTAKDIAESKKAVEKVNSAKGQAYIDTQRDLPDSITIP